MDACKGGRAAGWLLIVGGLQLGIMGLGNFLGNDWNVVGSLLGSWPVVVDVLYVLVGLGAVHGLMSMKGGCCGGKCKM
jgi:uncharacterized membrane protein YuzA (DUF378 family)